MSVANRVLQLDKVYGRINLEQSKIVFKGRDKEGVVTTDRVFLDDMYVDVDINKLDIDIEMEIEEGADIDSIEVDSINIYMNVENKLIEGQSVEVSDIIYNLDKKKDKLILDIQVKEIPVEVWEDIKYEHC